MIVKKSRKEHICEVCLKKIPKGSRYIRLQHEGGFDTKEHINCELHEDKFTAQESDTNHQ